MRKLLSCIICISMFIAALIPVTMAEETAHTEREFLFPDYHVFASDPSADIIDGRVYVTATHDPTSLLLTDNWTGFGFGGMYDIHMYSASLDDLTTWIDHGSICSSREVASWDSNPEYYDSEDRTKDSMMAADAANYANGKYYAYIPVSGYRIGVFECDTVTGRYKDVLGHPLVQRSMVSQDILDAFDEGNTTLGKFNNPHVFWDGDQAYLTCGQGNILIFPLNDDMISVDYDGVKMVKFGEGIKYGENGRISKIGDTYYLTYSTKDFDDTSAIGWATSDKIDGPYEQQGIFLKHVTYSSTTHDYFVWDEESQQALLFFHRANSEEIWQRRLSGTTFTLDEDGNLPTINPDDHQTWPTLGSSTNKVLLDGWAEQREAEEYAIASENVDVELGLKADFVVKCPDEGYIGFKDVVFGEESQGKLMVEFSAANAEAGKLEVYLDSVDGEKIAEMDVKGTDDWLNFAVQECELLKPVEGEHDIYFVFSGEGEGDLFHMSWFSFRKENVG